MSQLSVKVTGGVVLSENNPDFAYVRVQQDRMLTDEQSGFLRIKTVSALIPGSVKDLNRMGWVNGQTIGGKIVIREQLVPFYAENPERHEKVAGDTGVVCRSGDQVIYRNTFYSSNPEAQDVLIQHSNRQEILDAQAELEESNVKL